MYAPSARQRAAFVRVWLVVSALLVSGVLAATSQAATIIVNNMDGPNEGFNDASAPDPASTAGGNTGATLGAQRLNAFRAAANVWADALSSAVPIRVDATMDPLTCEASSGTLGSAGPVTAFRDFTSAPVANTWFVVALANSLSGTDLLPDDTDITAQFNSEAGTPGCLEDGPWYYGLDGDPPLFTIDFMTTVLHEIAHGLGFLSLVDLATGEKLVDCDDIFSNFLANRGSVNQAYPDMTDAERIVASTSVADLVWTGAAVNARSGFLSVGRHAVTGEVLMYAPSTLDEGSSVSHFDTTLSPDELMEPFANASLDMRLTLGVVADIGWMVTAQFPETLSVTTAATFVRDTEPSSVRNTFVVNLLQTDPVVRGAFTFRRCTLTGSPADGATNVGNCQWTTFTDGGVDLLRFSFNFRIPGTDGHWGQFVLVNRRMIGRFVRFRKPADSAAVAAASGPVSWTDNSALPPLGPTPAALLGTWRFMTEIGLTTFEDNYRLESLGTNSSGASIALGTDLDSGDAIIAGMLQDIVPGSTLAFDYALFDPDITICELFVFDLPTPTIASGLHFLFEASSGVCSSDLIGGANSTSGTRISAAVKATTLSAEPIPSETSLAAEIVE